MPVNRVVSVENLGNVTVSMRMLRMEDFQVSLNDERVIVFSLGMHNLILNAGSLDQTGKKG